MQQDTGQAPAGLSGLFPSGPPRPVYREPLPVRGAAAAAGAAAAGGWLVLATLLGSGLRGRLWWLLVAAAAAWLAALVLARYGDRGAAVGVALVTSAGLAGAAIVVAGSWFATGVWPLW